MADLQTSAFGFSQQKQLIIGLQGVSLCMCIFFGLLSILQPNLILLLISKVQCNTPVIIIIILLMVCTLRALKGLFQYVILLKGCENSAVAQSGENPELMYIRVASYEIKNY